MNEQLDRTNGPMIRAFDLIYKWLILNLLFVLFTIIGLGVFRVFPSLLSLFRVVKRIIQDKEESLPLFQTYKTTFKSLFVKANILFLFVTLIGGITVLDVVFLYNNYLGENDITFFGVLLSLGGLLLAYIVSGTIASIGVITAYFERFNVKDTIKFALLTTLSNPIMIMQFLLIIGTGYLVFSIVISAAPFLGISVPVWLIVLRYKKTFFQLFTIKQEGSYRLMYIRYLSDEADLIRIVEDMTSYTGEPVQHQTFEKVLQATSLDTKNSVLVLDTTNRPIGYLLLEVHDSEHHISCMAVDKAYQRRGIGSMMLQHLFTQMDIFTIVCDINKSDTHSVLKQLNGLARLLEKHEFTIEQSTTYRWSR